MPIYNGAEYLREALDSLLGQDYENTELIISDNASTDETQSLCLEYASKHPKVRYHRNETNRGAVNNFNRVFELSSGKYFMWGADHDVRHPTYLSRCVELMEGDPSVVLCQSESRWLGPDGQLGEVILPCLDTRGLDSTSAFQTVLWGLGNCYPVYGLLRSSALRRTGLFRDTFAPDNILVAELSLLGAIAYIPNTLFYFRKVREYDNWDRYLGNLKIRVTTKRSARALYRKMVYYHLAAVNAHVRGFAKKALFMLSVVACMRAKYRWVIEGLIDMANRQSRATGVQEVRA